MCPIIPSRKWIVAFCALAALCVCGESKAQSLVQNGGFEAWEKVSDRLKAEKNRSELVEDMVPSSWGIGRSECEGTELARDANVAHGGKTSLRLKNPSAKNISGVEQVLALEPDTRYRFSVWLKGENIEPSATRGGGVFTWLDGEYRLFKNDAKTFDWTEYTYTFDTPSQADKVKLRIRIQLHHASGTLWVDDFEVTPLEKIYRVESF